MAKFLNSLIAAALLLAAGPAVTNQTPEWASHLQSRGIRISAGVWDLSTGKVIEAFQPELGLIPASTTKVVSSYAILKTLKPDYQLVTTVSGALQDGVVSGDLVFSSQGDPFLTNEHIWMIIQQLKTKGLTRVSGRLKLDQSAFDPQRFGTGWENTARYTTPPILPLSVNFNRERDGRITGNPEKLARDTITSIFDGVGIHFDNHPDSGGEKAVLATHKSPPLRNLVDSVNKISNNFMIEMLVKHFGEGSWAKGIDRIQDFYNTSLNLTPTDVMITDGSGLSKSNRLSARTLSIILRAGWNDFEVGPEFVSSLKYLGGDEHLTKLKDPNLTRRVRCKTGHLNDVDSMCGFIQMPDGSVRVFAIILNGPCLREDVEHILKLWAN